MSRSAFPQICRRLAPIGVLAGLVAAAQADPAPDYSANLFGDLGGAREALAKVGVTLSATESSEVFANPVGGIRQGADYDGLTTVQIDVDTKAALGLEGGQIHVSGLNLHGDNFNTRDLGALNVVSGITGDRATRLWELWYDQKFGEHFDLKVGQQSLDNEFANHPSAGYFINAAFGWSTLDAVDLPGGGPAFPLSALGVRGRWQQGPLAVLAGVYSGTPATGSDPDPQHDNMYGVSFPVRGALAVAEAQYSVGQGEKEYAGVYKIGAWYDSLAFADQRYNIFGQPLADPAVNQTPLRHGGDFALYAVGEQVVWKGSEKERTLSLFLRPFVSPLADRNLVGLSVDGGLALRDPLPGRKDDTFAAGFALAQLSPGAIGYSGDLAFYNPGVYIPKRSYEAVFETSYQYQATPWAQIQPNLQYIHNPGAGLANPSGGKVRDELVAGLRLNISF